MPLHTANKSCWQQLQAPVQVAVLGFQTAVQYQVQQDCRIQRLTIIIIIITTITINVIVVGSAFPKETLQQCITATHTQKQCTAKVSSCGSPIPVSDH